MEKIKKHKSSGISPFIETQSLRDIAGQTGNLYESLVILSRRSNQISQELKEELHAKLEEFASTSDNLEEVFENREQIEISKYYEKLPHPTLLSLKEFSDREIYFRHKDAEDEGQNDA